MKHWDKKQKLGGFTLVELLVSSGIFSIIIVAIAGIFVGAINAQRYVISTETILSETEYAIDFMGRALRMAVRAQDGLCVPVGTTYQITRGGTGIKFINALVGGGECQEFYRDATATTRNIRIRRVPIGPISEQITDLTSPNVEVVAFRLGVSGDDPDDNLQPFVTVYLEARIGNVPAIKLQTSISQRNLDM